MGWMAGRLLCLAAVSTAGLALVPGATGAELTRKEYVARAEAVCRVVSQKATPLINRGFHEVKENHVRSAAPKLTRAAALLTRSRLRLAGIPRPPDDVQTIAAWLEQLKTQYEFLARAGHSLAEDERVRAQGYFTRFVHSGNLANDEVLGFGFKACLSHRRVE